jgi:hypothetical protein
MFNASAVRPAAIAGIEPGVQPLIDALENNTPHGMARFGVRIRLPQALAWSRRPAVVAMFMAPLRDFAERSGARLFALPERDVFVLLTDQDPLDLDRPLARMRETADLAGDRGAAPRAEAETETWDLCRPDQRRALLATLGKLHEKAPLAPGSDDPSGHRPAGSADWAALYRRMTPALAARCVRRRTVLAISSAALMSGLFEDYAPDGPRWQQALGCLPDCDAHDPAADDLAEYLKMNMVEAMMDGLLAWPEIPLGLHFPVHHDSSVLLAALLKRSGSRRLIIGIELRDALASLEPYDNIRGTVQRAGHRVVVSAGGIDRATFVDLQALQADFMCFYGAAGAATADGDRALWQATVSELGGERLILGGIDDEQRLQSGMELGIRHFSGHYIERLAAKLRMKGILTP